MNTNPPCAAPARIEVPDCLTPIALISRYGWIVLLVFFYGCAETTAVRAPVSIRDSAPKKPVDVTRIPDAVPKVEPRGRAGNASSYVVWGKRYKVMKKSRGFVQRGTASWYGKKFHGRKTANGETYNMYAMTAAHKSLPLPSYVRVKNLANGRSVVVRVNDRGPFHKNRIIDLSYTAAKKLGIVRTGTGRVEVRDISPVEQTAPVARSAATPAARATVTPAAVTRKTAPTRLYVQIGAFSSRENASRLADTVQHPELPELRIRSEVNTPAPLYRVQLGPVATIGEAHRIIDQLGELGITTTRLVSEPLPRNHTRLQ